MRALTQAVFYSGCCGNAFFLRVCAEAGLADPAIPGTKSRLSACSDSQEHSSVAGKSPCAQAGHEVLGCLRKARQVCMEPRLLPAETKLMSAKIASCDFRQ